LSIKPSIRIPLVVAIAAETMLSSCNGRDDDTTVPIIESLSMNKTQVSAGESFEVETTVADDRKLNQVKFDIHDRFDEHDHERPAGIPWEETRIVPVDGPGYLLIESFTVPQNATAGPYHVVVQVVDRAGNTGQFRETNFWIANPVMAHIELQSPDLQSSPQYDPGDVLALYGTVTDNSEIHEIRVELFDEEGTVYMNFDEELAGQGITSYNLNTAPVITFDEATFGPSTKTLTLSITALDDDENISQVKGNIQYK